jgi:hypothetical protein
MRQAIGQIVNVMIVDDRNRADRLAIVAPFARDERVSDEIANGFGAVRVVLVGNVPIEVVEQMVIQ